MAVGRTAFSITAMTPGAVVEVIDVSVEDRAGEGPLAGCGIDMPEPGATRDTFDLEVRGWAVGRREAAMSVELAHEDVLLTAAPLDVSRPKLAAQHPDTGAGESIGFRALIGALRLPTEFELDVRAVTEGGERAPIGRLRGRRSQLHTSFVPTLQPLMVTTLGRTGSMMLMRMLEAHPEVLVYRPFRYEQRVASYWIEVMLSLCEPASYFRQLAPAGSLDDPRWWLGEDGGTPTGLRDEEIQRWLGFDAVRELAEVSQTRIERLYTQIAERETGGSRPSLFAEKYALGVSHLVRELYPDARELFLVRDFRDMVSSIIAFDEKRGTRGFGRGAAKSDREYVEALAGWAARLVRSYEQRAGRSTLVRYEDLVLEPEQTLRDLLEYLAVTSTDEVVSAMLEALQAELPELAEHRTTPDPGSSIGRWREDLSAELLEACQEAFGPALATFGYPEK
jgi:sulfotransferase family protein